MARMKRTRRMSRTTRKKPRRSGTLTQTQSRQVARIAKRATLRLSETKRRVALMQTSLQTADFAAYNLTNLAQGDDISQRNGRQIIATSLRKQLFIRNNSFLEPVIVRTLILQGKEGNYEDITSTSDIFNNSYHPDDGRMSWDEHTGNGKLLAIMKPIDSTRYTVKEDKTFVLGTLPNPNLKTTYESAANHDGRSSVKMIRNSLNLKKKIIHYGDSSATVTEDIGDTQETRSSCENRLHFVIMCSQVDGSQITGSAIAILGIIVLYYKDP